MNPWIKRLSLPLFLFSSLNTFASNADGLWATLDEQTGKKRAIIRVSEDNGEVKATVVKSFKKSGDISYCTKCPGDFKNKPILGMTFVWGLKQTSPNTWENGFVLDPESGRIYKMKMTLQDKQHLAVRGYLGMSLIGRTQVWEREG